MWTTGGFEIRETLQPGEEVPMSHAKSAERVVRDIQRKTRRRFSAEEKIRIILEGLRGEESIASLCRREGLNPNLYYRWSKEFLEAGKKRLLGDTTREATSTEVADVRKEVAELKQLEPHPPAGAPARSRRRLGRPRAVAAGAGVARHGPRGAFSLGIERLSHPQGLRSDPT